MTIHAVERALWTIGNVAGAVDSFKSDPQSFLAGYRLDSDERIALAELDIRRLSDRGANTLLLLAVQRAVKGGDSIPDYMRQINTPAE